MADREPHPAWKAIEKAALLPDDPNWPCERLDAPGKHEIELSKAISLKRIADALDSSDDGGRPQGSVLWWLENIASAANAGRS